MLIEKTEYLINELNDLESLQEISNESSAFNKRNVKLKSISSDLEILTTSVCLFSSQGFKIDTESIFSFPNSAFNKLKIKWENDKSSILKPNDFFSKVDFKSIDNEVKINLQNQWEGHVDNVRPSIHMGQLKVLKKIPDLSILVFELQEKLKMLNELKGHLPEEEASFKLVISLVSEMKELWEQLSSNNIPDEVVIFLKKAGNDDGINLSEITQEIMEWLNKNNLTHLCQVKFKSDV
jgi:hypothetical protein